MHTLMAREHNRIAKALAVINPHWDDEILFQEARRIVIAEIQHITYNEFLPILLGKDVMEKFGLLLEKEKYWDGYDQSINPGVIDAFAAAAFRFGHSLLPTAVERWSKAHKFIASKRLSDLIRRPYDLYRAGVFDEYLMGLMNQVAQAMDDSITQEVTNHLFKKVGAKFGLDLVSFNMQRGREFGIPSYMEFR
ncbi:PREDICTED: chorion peroxidase-like [Trachymyrmex cornetzi]|uniref:chorion peroxidase-like n=1 Tax=Trachymyrmex cornetzi TaxID=471704 RepID=UPI00084ED289|nr:PREDICTED: chorion peroxidase-like [Trachymyrmex cornetzi]